MFRLDDKVAIVTGAARGIGRAVADALTRQGARVAGVDLDVNQLGEVAKGYKVDVADVTALKRLVDEVVSDLGRIDILVNNAGICPRLPFGDSTEADWEKLFSINAKSQYFLMQAVCPVMKRQGGGRIINMASSGGRTGSFANASIYSGTKGAIIMFSKSVAREVAGDGILVNCVAPGCINTDLISNLPAEKVAALCNTIPLKRLGQPEEIAALVAYLASDECSYCTGATFDINGGWIML